MVGWVGFGEFVILWLKPNPTHYNFFFFCNPSLKNRPNLVGRVGSGRVGSDLEGRWVFCTPLSPAHKPLGHKHLVGQEWNIINYKDNLCTKYIKKKLNDTMHYFKKKNNKLMFYFYYYFYKFLYLYKYNNI